MRQLGHVFTKPYKNKSTYHIAGISRTRQKRYNSRGKVYYNICFQVNHIDEYGLTAFKSFYCGIEGKFTARHERKKELEAIAFRIDFVDRMRRQAARGALAASKR